MNIKKYILGILLLTALSGVSQEVLTPLSSNPQLRAIYQMQKRKKRIQEENIPSKFLPFFDDFSNTTGYPDSTLWTDRYVYINAQYALFPPSVGVATFDALDETGNLYTTDSKQAFSADTLTSCYIRLDSVQSPPHLIEPNDSVYLSFFYQPGGGSRNKVWENQIGDAPEKGDSLVLEFYNKDSVWVHAWAVDGMYLDSLLLKTNGRYFAFVNIAITDSSFFHDKFRFRFRNYCSFGNPDVPSMVANCDMWHIDYVRLDVNRTMTDTAYTDLAFVYPAVSFLKDYQAVPARQFRASDVISDFSQYLTNNSDQTHSSHYRYDILDENKNVVDSKNQGNENIEPFWTNGYQTLPVHAQPPVTYKFPSINPEKRTTYEIVHVFKEGVEGAVSDDKCVTNDTNRFFQHFKNYFAYDDGSAENGYGITSMGAKFAYKFVLNTSDTLTAVQIYFNQALGGSNASPFHLTVWNDHGGMPGSIIYQQMNQDVIFPDKINHFALYQLDQPLVVNSTIYIGWEQTDETNLNVGFDRNTDARGKMFYNTGLVWQESFLKGSVMLRPVFGAIDNDMLDITELRQARLACKIYPNPASTVLHIEMPAENQNHDNYYVDISNMLGQKILHIAYTSSMIDIQHLDKGCYVLNIYNKDRSKFYTSKLVVQ